MSSRVPAYVERFADAITAAPPTSVPIELPGADSLVVGRLGILTTSQLHAGSESSNALARQLEFTFWIEPVHDYRGTEVSLQLYENVARHWRLFAFSRAGMLLSLNLTTTRRRGVVLELGQVVAVRNKGLTSGERERRAEAAANTLRLLGLDVSVARKLIVGTFDAHHGEFLDTTASGFVRAFLLSALVMGHFHGNKGYQLPIGIGGIAPVSRGVRERARMVRSIPLGLRYEVLHRDESTCQRCGRTPIRDGVILHIDHVLPYSQGGHTTLENLQTLRHLCNLGKGNRFNR